MISKNKVKYVRSLEMKKFRKADAVFVAEGYKLVGDLLDVFECTYLVATAEWLLAHDVWVHKLNNRGVEVDEVTEEELKRVSFQETPQQVLAVFKQPVYEVDVNVVAKKNLCLVLDDVQNPGNLGTIVRLADWFGIEHIFCSKGCADIYNPKTVRATMGAMFKIKTTVIDSGASFIETMKAANRRPIACALSDNGMTLGVDDIYKTDIPILGNEGHGVSDETIEACGNTIIIPMSGKTESLNAAAAAAIILWEYSKIK